MGSIRRTSGAFSLVELVIVIVILGVIGAIAIPRMSRGAGAAGESTLRQDLSTLRRSVELYRAEHEGLIPTDDVTITGQLTMYTDIDGNTNATKTAVFKYGPYLRAIPPLPVGKNKGSRAFRDGGGFGDGSEGWFYNKNTGEIRANCKNDQLDSNGVKFNAY